MKRAQKASKKIKSKIKAIIKPRTITSAATRLIAETQGNSGYVFGDVRPSPDIELNTEVSGETSRNQPRQPLPEPRPTGRLNLDLADILDADSMASIQQHNQLVFHTVGDTGGVHSPHAQLEVADRMEQDLSLPEPDQPSFFLHLGDVVYYDGQAEYYYEQFYYPYRHYNAPIFAIPGNHDGDMPDGLASAKSLEAFVRNFCAAKPAKTTDAKDALRTSMTQPYVYFTLNTPLATFVNLYTNCPSNGYVDQLQRDWLKQALKSAPDDKALILSLHHPVFSEDGEHGSNSTLLKLIDEAVGDGRHPDMVLTAHVHNYQRFTRTLADGSEVPYIVAGCGGYYDLYPVGIYNMQQSIPDPVNKGLTRTNPDRTLVNYVDTHFGYLRFTVTPSKITGVFQPCCPGLGISKYSPIDDPNLDITKPADTNGVKIRRF